MSKYIRWLLAASMLTCFCAIAGSSQGELKPELVGKLWRQLPPSKFPGFSLPLHWEPKSYALKLFEPEADKYVVTVVKIPSSKDQNDATIVAALDFTSLKDGQTVEHDCYYKHVPACDGRLCDGLLIGVITQRKRSKAGTYMPSEAWKITSKSLKFEEVSAKNVVCRPQSYAN